MFIDFCTSCGNFDSTSFTAKEKEIIQSFSDIVTNIYNKAKKYTDTYNDCKANVLADPKEKLTNQSIDWLPKGFLDVHK